VILGSLVLDPISFISFSLFALIPSIALGRYYKMGLASSKIIPKMVGLMILMLMIGLLLIESLLDISLLADIGKSITQMMNEVSAQGLSPVTWNSDVTDSFVKMMLSMIPLVFFIMALLI